ncbi:hypothetical protein Scep_020839 [Stephania cephalantha]|uniref:Uncharacterized protein n=1 Tax=Stephania cephalantha TaxID=152367 RepID=A0AAP0I121_9MAGN
MGAFLWHLFSSSALFILGLYHMVSATLHYLRSNNNNNNNNKSSSYSAKPYHPLSLPGSNCSNCSNWGWASPRLPLYLILATLLISSARHLFLSTLSDPLLLGGTPVHRLTSLHSSALLFLFFLLSLSLLLPLPFPPNFFFATASALFFLLSSASSASASLQTSHLQAACSSISSRVSALSSLLSFILACNPKLFIIDLALAASLSLQGLWVLQTGLSLYVDAFIPEGCHRLLDVTSGVEGSTRCDLDDSRFRAAAILDLAFVFHVMFLMLIVALTYALLAAKTTTFGISSSSSSSSSPAVAAAYQPLPTTNNHVQMKTLAGTQA